MRIIAGKAGGRRIESPKTSATRPATDRVREAVFSIIGDWVVGAAVADLYAGSGSFGLEALSRGAASAVFVEKGASALKALRTNVTACKLGGEVVEDSVEHFLRKAEGRFDLVFVDPPWPLTSDELGRRLHELDRLVDPRGEVVISRRHTDDLPDTPKSWEVATNRTYGDTRIIRYEKGS